MQVTTSDTADTENVLSAIMPPARLMSRAARYSSALAWASLDGMNFVCQEHYGFERIAVVGEVPRLVVTIPLMDALDVEQGGRTTSVAQGGVYISNVGDSPVLKSGPHSAFFSAVIPEQALSSSLDRHLPHRMSSLPRFDPSVPIKYSRALTSAIYDTRVLMTGRTRMPASTVESMSHAVVSALLFTYPHSLMSELFRSGARASDAAVWDAVSRIRARPESRDPITDIAGDLNVSVRSLQLRFRELVGVSPSVFQRNARLDRAHQLMAADRLGVSLSAVAFDVGYVNQGRFARDFRERFGELPSTVRRRNRETIAQT